jgi:hypothetical protein
MQADGVNGLIEQAMRSAQQRAVELGDSLDQN